MKSVYNCTNFAMLVTSAKFALNSFHWTKSKIATVTDLNQCELVNEKRFFSLQKAIGSHVNYA